MKVKCIFSWIPQELHTLIPPKANSHFLPLSCAAVIHPALFRNQQGKPTDILPGFASSPLQPPREQCHNDKLGWLWADNVLCLRTARRFTMKGCQRVRRRPFSLVRLSLRLCEGPPGTWWRMWFPQGGERGPPLGSFVLGLCTTRTVLQDRVKLKSQHLGTCKSLNDCAAKCMFLICLYYALFVTSFNRSCFYFCSCWVLHRQF